MGGGQGGCERRIKVFAKIQKKKKIGGGEGLGGRVGVEVNEELKFLWGGGGAGVGGGEEGSG